MKYTSYFALVATLIAYVLLPAFNAMGVEGVDGKRIVVCTALGIQNVDLSEQDTDHSTKMAPYQCSCTHFSHVLADVELPPVEAFKSAYDVFVTSSTQAVAIFSYSSRAPPLSV